MKIAVISDIHGNIEALNAVLKNIEEEHCSKIFCLGDLAMAGPELSLTITKINELQKSKDFTLIQGNTDEYLGNYSQEVADKIKKASPVMANAYIADLEELSEEEKSYLRDLPSQKEITIGKIKILLVHGSPRRNDENIFPDMRLEEIEKMLEGFGADIIFCGHTHIPCGYQTNTKQTVVNVGSVGRPFFNVPKSCYVVLDIDENSSEFQITHKFVDYDYQISSNKLKSRGFEGCSQLADMLVKVVSRYP